MANNDLKDVDLEIAEFYAPIILGSLKHGENRICIWFPGCGKTNTINSVLSNKNVLKKNLGELYKRVVFIPFSGHDSESGLSIEVLQQAYLKLVKQQNIDLSEISTFNIIDECKKIIDQGKEIVFIGNEIENLPQIEYNKLLSNLLRIALTNRARIHTIINIKNKDMYDKAILSNSSILTLSNKIQYIPVVSGDLLRKIINKFIYVFEKKISLKEVKRIEKHTGGILILTKELIRSYPDEGQFKFKLRECLKHLSKNFLNNMSVIKSFNADKLNVIKDSRYLTENDPKDTFLKTAKDQDRKLFEFFIKNKGKLINKDSVANILWGEDSEGYSDWAIDQIVSRFRKRLRQAEIDPKSLETVKGKGYKWRL